MGTMNVCRKCGNLFELSMTNCPKCKTSSVWKSKPGRPAGKWVTPYCSDRTTSTKSSAGIFSSSESPKNSLTHSKTSIDDDYEFSVKGAIGCFGVILALIGIVLSFVMPHIAIPILLFVTGKGIAKKCTQ